MLLRSELGDFCAIFRTLCLDYTHDMLYVLPESGILALYTLPAFPPLARLGRSFRYIVHRPPLFVSPPHVCDSNAFPACCSKPRGLSATMSKERLDLFWQA